MIGERNCEMSFQFRSKANFQNFVQAIKSTNLQTHKPVNFKKTTKIEPHENKVFHSNIININVPTVVFSFRVFDAVSTT